MPSKYNTLTPRLTILIISLLTASCQLAPIGSEAIVSEGIQAGGGPSIEGTLVSDAEMLAAQDDLWQRIRQGTTLTPETQHANVLKQRDWYLRNPNYLAVVFERAKPFIFHVTNELDKASLPLTLALLPIVESTYDPLAYSRSHAVGLWQFIPSTGKAFGLKRDRWYDGRRDVTASTQAAIKYLQYLHKRFDNDWLLALAAYNSGEGNVRKSINANKKRGETADFWSIKLPRETRNYVPQLLALAMLIENPQDYDIVLPAIPNQPYFEAVEIKSQIDLNKVIAVTGAKAATFTQLNPAYRRSITPPQGKFSLLFPVGTAEPLRQMLATTDPKTWIPHTEHMVVNGDTLSEIAQRFRIPLQWLMDSNSLHSDRLKLGQVLLIPHSGDDGALASVNESRQSLYKVKSGDSLSMIASRYKTSVTGLKRANGLNTDVLQLGQTLTIRHNAALPTPENLRKLSYKVRRGDSLYLIAEKFDLRIRDITRWNKISPHAYLQPGQRLTLFINALRI
ncbi:MAG: LysM peptidoglycan-binding domain-containing protein [Porticoccaceae bacterium]